MNKDLSLFKKFLLKFWYYTPEGESLYDFCKRYEIIALDSILTSLEEVIARKNAMDNFIREVDTFDDKTKIALYHICFDSLTRAIFIRDDQPILPSIVIKKNLNNLLEYSAVLVNMMAYGLLPFWVFEWCFNDSDAELWNKMKYFWFVGITNNQKSSSSSKSLSIKAISDKKNNLKKEKYVCDYNHTQRYIEWIFKYMNFSKEELDLFFK